WRGAPGATRPGPGRRYRVGAPPGHTRAAPGRGTSGTGARSPGERLPPGRVPGDGPGPSAGGAAMKLRSRAMFLPVGRGRPLGVALVVVLLIARAAAADGAAAQVTGSPGSALVTGVVLDAETRAPLAGAY